MATQPDIVLITIDTLRADHVSAFGATKVKTPAMDALVADGIAYENAISQVPLTFPSHASILTGTYPFHNGVQDFTSNPLAPTFRTLAEAFKASGYDTAAFVSSFVLDRSFGLARGFDEYQDDFSGRKFQSQNLALVERTAGETMDKVLSFLRNRRSTKPLFLWLHLYDPHSPYSAPQPFRANFAKDPYSGEVAYVDRELRRYFTYLKQTGKYSRTGIMLLSDHGESLGEHGEREHGFFVYRSTTHIPLIWKPAASKRAVRIKAAVGAIQVASTLLDAARIKDSLRDQLQAPALPTSEGTIDQDSLAYSETFYPFSSFGWNPLRAMHSDKYEYISAPRAELYNHIDDPQQTTNLISNQPAVVAALSRKLAELTNRYPGSDQAQGSGVSEDVAAKLRALGYVSSRSPVPVEAIAKGLPDPKDKVNEMNLILRATDALESGKTVEGRQLLEQARVSDPGLYLIPFLLGQAALRERDWTRAIEEFDRCLKLNPHFDQAMTAAAQALFPLGKNAEAIARLNEAIDLNPNNYRAWYQLGFMQMRSDPVAAETALQKVLALQPNFSLAHRDLGMLLSAKQDYRGASQHLESAIRGGMNDPEVLNAAGIAASQTGDLSLAEKNLQRALALAPNYAEAHLNLGLVFQKTGRAGASRKEYETACQLKSTLCQYVRR
jgi:arylsulfatase A-like enzyme/Flp pilus assembly protein TadD